MNVVEELLVRLLGFKDYFVPRGTLYVVVAILLLLLVGLPLLSYDTFILVLALTLPILMLPLLTLPLVYRSQISIYRKTRSGVAGSTANVELILRNKSNIPLIVVVEESSRSLRFNNRHVIGISAKGTRKLTYGVRGRTGKHRLYSKITVLDPLGVIGVEKKNAVTGDDSIRFKPRVLALKGLLSGVFTQTVPGGGFRGNLKGLGYDFYGLRKYIYGDPIKLVDWKTSARWRELFVKEYVLEAGIRVLLALLLTSKSFDGEPSFFEEAADAIVSVMDKLLASGSSVGFVVGSPLYNGLVGVGRGKIILESSLEIISNVPWINNGNVDLDLFIKNILKASRHPRNTKLILLTQSLNYLGEELYYRILRLRRTGFEKINILVVEETPYPLPELYVLLEKNGVKVTSLRSVSRNILGEKILEAIGMG